MIDLLIAILIALSTHTACDLGTDAGDWYTWAHDHPDMQTVATLETDQGDVWLYYDELSDTYLLFVFREDVSDTLAAGRHDPHGQCVRVLTNPERNS